MSGASTAHELGPLDSQDGLANGSVGKQDATPPPTTPAETKPPDPGPPALTPEPDGLLLEESNEWHNLALAKDGAKVIAANKGEQPPRSCPLLLLSRFTRLALFLCPVPCL